jgi:transient receptor potential cation channel subfamily V protein 5
MHESAFFVLLQVKLSYSLSNIWLKIECFFLNRGFRTVGPFVLMVHKMMKGDMIRFFIIYSVFLLGFSQGLTDWTMCINFINFFFLALYIVCDFGIEDELHPIFRTPLESMLNIFILSLGEFKDSYNELTNAKYEIIGKILFVIFMVLVGILLLNLLIATMGNTYAEVNETKNEWLRQV